MNENNVARFIIETVKQNPGIMGCRLGALVKQAFPWFKGLRAYVAQNCASEVVVVAVSGEDFSYAHVSHVGVNALSTSQSVAGKMNAPDPAPSQIAQDSQQTKAAPTASAVRFIALPNKPTAFTEPNRNATFWQAFTNPSVSIRLAINKSTSEMSVITSATGVEPPLAEIPKVTKDEHAGIMKGFLDLLEPADRQYLHQSIGPEISWSRWSAFMWHFDGGKYSSLWLNYRTATLRRIFEERLSALGVSETVIPVLVTKLMDSKQQRRNFGQDQVLDGLGRSLASKNTVPVGQVLREDYVRKLALAAVARMDIDELRSLRLPLGSIVDLLENNALKS